MKLRITPLLEDDQSSFEADHDSMSPRSFVDLMDQRKALLFQSLGGDEPFSVQDFGHFVVNRQLESYPNIGGEGTLQTNVPVEAGERIIFTASESSRPITPFYHHKLALPVEADETASEPPEYVFFYCDDEASPGGGEMVSLMDATAIYRFAKEHHPNFVQTLQQEGARFIQTLSANACKNIWNVASSEALEERLSKIDGCEWEWLPDGESVRITTKAVPALRLVTDHAQNFVYQHVVSHFAACCLQDNGAVGDCDDHALGWVFGNDNPMPNDALQSIAKFVQEHRVQYKLKKGDIIALNHSLVIMQHGCTPTLGGGRILTSIWGPPKCARDEPANGIALGKRPDSYYEGLKPADPLVFGFWKVPKEVCAQVAYDAIAAGYRRLDCACDYGNEEQVGQGIARALKEGICQRSDLFVTGKLWNTYHDPKHVPLAFQKSLTDLQLTYLDEYLIHFPISMEFVPIEEKYPPEWTNLQGNMVAVPNDMGATWKAMEALVDQGLCQRIGVCNFSTQLLRQLLSTCRIRPTTLQVELHPHNSQERLVRFAHDAGLNVTAFSVLGASSYLELDMATAGDMLLQDATVQCIATTHRKTPAQVLLRWALQRNTLPLCKTCTKSRMTENRNIFDFYLTGAEMMALNGLNKNRRYNDPGAFCEPGMGTFYPIYD